jgi:uncharacterized protein (TIGR02118 family)
MRNLGAPRGRERGRRGLPVAPATAVPRPGAGHRSAERARHPGADSLSRMHRLLVLYPPPTDPDHFRSYYEATHLKLVEKLPGLLGFRYGFDVAAGEGDSPYFCIFEGDFDDAAAMDAALESPPGQAALADIPNYATGGAVPLNYELRAG